MPWTVLRDGASKGIAQKTACPPADSKRFATPFACTCGPIAIQYGILLPILIGALMIWRSEATKRILAAVPQQWLVGVQFFRALGAIFLILSATGTLPRLFALPAGLGDTVVGLLAPVVGLAYAKAPHKSAGLVAAWNVLGLLDLTDALGLGFLTAPSRFALEIQPTSDLMTVLPLVLVPVYLVPLFFVLHLASLAKLYREVIASNGHGRGVHARA